MKSKKMSIAGVLASALIFAACERSASNEIDPPASRQNATALVEDAVSGKNNSGPAGPCNPNAYSITLEGVTQVGSNYEWVWSVQNPNPGNGNNGTVQDLSHWGMQFGNCVQWSSVVSAAYSDDGSNWSSFSPSYGVDPSQNCMTTPVLKFNYGTSGSNKTYYKLVVSTNYLVGQSSGYYKSGSNTGCCTFTFSGIGCTIPTDPADEK